MASLFNKTRGWKLPAIAIVGVLFALSSVMGRSSPPPKEPPINPPVAQYSGNIAGIGVVEPQSELIAIGTELPGIVRQVYVKVGDNVKMGDPLFSLDQRDIDSQISILQSSLAAAKVQAEDANAQFNLVKGMEDRRAVAKDDFNHRKFGSELAEIRVKEISAQLTQALTTKERLSVKAPITGQILEVNVRAGEFATNGATGSPLMRMGDVDVLNVRVEIDEELATRFDAKAPAKGLRRGDTKNAIPLTFVRFEPYVRPKQNLATVGQRVDTRVLQVIYALPKEHIEAFVGQQMDVYIESTIPDKETALP